VVGIKDSLPIVGASAIFLMPVLNGYV